MLYLVGLGLADETDITVKGLEVVKKAERVYLEAYTSILLVDRQKLVGEPPSSVACCARVCGKKRFKLTGVLLISRKRFMAVLLSKQTES